LTAPFKGQQVIFTDIFVRICQPIEMKYVEKHIIIEDIDM
jgi:hypothetical protein